MEYLEKLSKFIDDSIINKIKIKANELEKILWDINNVLENNAKIKFTEKEILQMVWNYNDSLYSDEDRYNENPCAFMLYLPNQYFDKDNNTFTFCTAFDGTDYVVRTHIAGILALSDEASKDLLYSEINKLESLKYRLCACSLENINRLNRYKKLLDFFRIGFAELENRKTQLIDKDEISKIYKKKILIKTLIFFWIQLKFFSILGAFHLLFQI